MRYKVISKNLLQTFIQQRRLHGVVAFLNFIKSRNNLQIFYNFCDEHDQIISKVSGAGVLFHGSPEKQVALTPHGSVGRDGTPEQKAFVYATDDPNYAIFLAILNLKNGGASVNASRKSTHLFVDLDFVNGSSKLKNGYAHIVGRESLKKTKNREYKSDRKINVLFTISVTPADLTVPIYIQTS
ncbi:MAG: hypothetical protein WDZ35_06865 [Crocinitomicaceae bacterium]